MSYLPLSPGDNYSDIHDVKFRAEVDGELVYAARNNSAEGIKFNALSDEIVLKPSIPEPSRLKLQKFSPTAFTLPQWRYFPRRWLRK
jgi:hypothetical protein